MPNTPISKWREMKPALREWHWLIQQNKRTQEGFIADIIHRLDLTLQEELSLLEERVERMKKLIPTFISDDKDSITAMEITMMTVHNQALSDVLALLRQHKGE